MKYEILSKSPEELIALYRQTSKELNEYLLDGGSWDEQQERILMLNDVSKELTRRKIEIQKEDNRPITDKKNNG